MLELSGLIEDQAIPIVATGALAADPWRVLGGPLAGL